MNNHFRHKNIIFKSTYLSGLGSPSSANCDLYRGYKGSASSISTRNVPSISADSLRAYCHCRKKEVEIANIRFLVIENEKYLKMGLGQLIEIYDTIPVSKTTLVSVRRE